MENLKIALFEYLTALPSITDLIGTRLFPMQVPSSAVFDYVTYIIASDEHDHHMLAPSGLAFNTVDFDLWSLSSIDNGLLRKAFRAALDGFRGEMGDVDIRSIQLNDERESLENPTDASQDAAFRTLQEYSIIQREFVPVFPAN